MKRSKKILWICIIVIFVVIAGVLGRNYLNMRAVMTARLNIANMATTKVTRGDLRVTVAGNGKAEFSEKEELTADTDGKILKVNVKKGDHVKKGDIIAEIDISDAVTAKENEIQRMMNKIKLQEVAVKEQSNSLEELQNTKNNSVITAPFTGLLIEFPVKTGDTIYLDQRIGTLADTSQLRLVLPFEKEQAEKVHVGQKVDVYLIDYIDKGIKTQGEIISISNSADGGQAISDVEVVLEGKEGYEAGANASFALEIDGAVIPPMKTGRLEWIDTYTLISNGSGKVKEILKEADDNVSEGEILIRLENKNIDLDIQKAQYSIESSQIDLDSLRDQLEQLYEDLEEIKANSLLLAPIDGVISSLDIEPSDQVKAGTIAAIISNTSQLVVPIFIDELDISKVKEGQKAEVTLDALEDKIFTGTVDEVALEGKNESGIGSFEVIVALSSHEGIKPGMSANVEILVSEKADTLILPIEAIQKSDDQYIVTLKPASVTSGEQLRKGLNEKETVTVKLGLVSDSYVEILEGVSEGDEVIITGQEEFNWPMMPGMGRAQQYERTEGRRQEREFTPPAGR